MSLIHWWPLNGDLKDRGVANSDLNVLYGTPSFTVGKIGKCANLTSGEAYYISSSMACNSVTGYSVAAWVKFNSLDSGHRSGIWSNRDPGPVWSSCEIYNNKLHYYHYNNAWLSTFGNTTLTTGRWYHVCFVIKNRVVTFYLDGVKDGSGDATLSGDNQNLCDSVGCSWSGGYALNGYLNDVRIYDHALSVKEVREISKGLILHYTFEDPYVEGTTNLANQTDVGGWNNSGTATWGNPDTTISNKPCVDSKIISLYKDDNGNSCITFGNCGDTSIRSKTVTASTWVYLEGNQSGDVVYLRSGAHDNGICNMSYNGSIYCSQWPKNQWIRISGTGTIASDESYVYFCSYLNNAGEKRAFNGWQLEQKDHATPYVNGTRQPGLIYDNSGYGYNGTQNGSLQTLKDSACGEYSANIVNSYIKVPTLTCPECTILFWIKRNSLTGTRQFIYTGWPGISIELTESNGWLVYYTTDSSYNTVYIPVNQNLDANVWYHIGIVIGKSGNYSFINGVQKGTSSYLAPYYGTNDFRIGSYGSYVNFNAKIADFKIYSTALSASDILAEYNRKAAIDRNGNLFTGEFIEGNVANIKVEKASIVAGNNFVEGTDKVKFAENFIQLEYLGFSGTSSAGQFIRTGITSLTHPFSVRTIYNKTNTEIRDQTLVGQRQLGKYVNIYNTYYETLYGSGGENTAPNNQITSIEVRSAVGVIKNDNVNLFPTQSTNNQTSNYELLIGAFSEGDYTGAKWFFNGYIYEITILNNGELYRHFIPAKRKSDNVLGLYDLVNRVFYTNAGSGSFVAGPEVDNIAAIYSNELIEN